MLGAVGAALLLCCAGGSVVLVVKALVERANDSPSDIEVGEEFKHDGFVADAGWRVVEERGDFDIVDLDLTNEAIGVRAAFLELTLYRDGDYLATISCSSRPIPHGDSGRADCFSADPYVEDYDGIAVADTF